tara:strand:- start:1865 stop:2968 length:1104 start_codon:yes stop_codon:yes gene_type:complete
MLVILTIHLNAQERCGTTTITKHMMDFYPEYKVEREKVNAETKKWIQDNPQNDNKTIITIPVVVHVVWKTNAENISDAQIFSQIDILNNDFRRTNIDIINTPDSFAVVAADCQIDFCLATTDPNGNPTTGITRTETTVDQFGMFGGGVEESSSGGKDAWPNDDYLNIWVCNLGNGLLGYATPPSNWIGNTDGVVINYPHFGESGNTNAPYHKGRTATHEVGHWLNLEHLWGGGWGAGCSADDDVTDTPNQEEENYGCQSFPHNANACGTPNGDMFMNYMDYTNDACMNLFTEGQKTRMIAAINQYRPNMLTHNLCNSPTDILETISNNKKLLKIIDILGRETIKKGKASPLFYIYDDGSVEKKMIVK